MAVYLNITYLFCICVIWLSFQQDKMYNTYTQYNMMIFPNLSSQEAHREIENAHPETFPGWAGPVWAKNGEMLMQIPILWTIYTHLLGLSDIRISK